MSMSKNKQLNSKSKIKQRKKHKHVTKGKERQRQRRKPISFQSVTRTIKNSILRQKPKNITSILNVALKTVGKNNEKIKKLPRVIQIPKTGGILPLIPIFAGLSALGALSGGAASIAKAVNDARAAKEQLKEHERHNKTMESIAIGKGLYLKQHKGGLGLFLDPRPKTHTYQ